MGTKLLKFLNGVGIFIYISMKFWDKFNTFIKTKKSTATYPSHSPLCVRKSQFIKMKPGSLIYNLVQLTPTLSLNQRHIQGKTHFGLSQQNLKCMNDMNR